MFVGNFKSYSDMEAKKKAQLDLLKVMAENEEEKERRVRDYRNPYLPTPVPPPYKTAGQRRAEGVEQEKIAYTNLSTLGDLSVSEILFVINAIRRSDETEGIVKFNAFYPQIKSRLLRSVNPAFLTGNYLANWIVDYIRRSDTLNPLAFSQTGEMLQSSFADATNIYPNYEIMAEFKDLVFTFSRKLFSIPSIDERVASEVEEGLEQLATLLEITPQQKDLNEVREKASSVELEDFAKFLQAYYQNTGSLDNRVIASLSKDLVEKMDMGIISQLESSGRVLIRRLKNIRQDSVLKQQHSVYLAKVESIVSENKDREELLREYQENTPIRGDFGEGGVPTQQLSRQPSTDPLQATLDAAAAADYIFSGTAPPDPLSQQSSQESDMSSLAESEVDFIADFNEDEIDTYVEDIEEEYSNLDDIGKVKQIKAILLTILYAYNTAKSKVSLPKEQITKTQGKYSDSKAIIKFMDERDIELFYSVRPYLFDFIYSVELGTTIQEAYENLIYAKNNELPQQFARNDEGLSFEGLTFALLASYMKAKKQAYAKRYNPTATINSASSALEVNNLRGSQFTRSQYGYNLKRGFGVRNRMAVRPAVMPPTYKKPILTIDRKELLNQELRSRTLSRVGAQPHRVKVGKGIKVINPEDTYKSFGKHILHYPQLRDTNTLNIKFPSGTKNYVKKQIISNDYKDLIMDILERGKVSDGLYDRLGEDEKQHFTKIVKGAGLMEQLKVKPPKDKNMKVLAERFKILRGQFMAGNNAPTLIEELKKIIVIFMENSILTKEDGTDLLREIK
jgi:hypothetical protein